MGLGLNAVDREGKSESIRPIETLALSFKTD